MRHNAGSEHTGCLGRKAVGSGCKHLAGEIAAAADCIASIGRYSMSASLVQTWLEVLNSL